MFGWYVVEFLNENTFQTILSSWMVNFETCLWPTTSFSCIINLALKIGLKPPQNSKGWKYSKIRVLSKKTIFNFNEASKITKDFIQQYSTEAKVNKSKKSFEKARKNKKKVSLEECIDTIHKRYISSSSS